MNTRLDFSYPKSVRLRNRRQYLRMNGGAHRLNGSVIAIDVMKNGRETIRLGITVTKRYGDAHKRNRFKRLVREAFRLCRHCLPRGFDINVKPRQPLEQMTLASIGQELVSLLKASHQSTPCQSNA